MIERVAQDLEHDQQQERGDRRRRHGFVLAVAVGMVLVGRLPGGADADQADDVRRGVGQRMEAVGQDADRAARSSRRRSWRRATAEVEQQDADEDARDRSAWRAGTDGSRSRLSAGVVDA